jgi:hypothetical protein
MPGERFSALYVQAGDPTPDSNRARRRIGALFHEPLFAGQIEQLAAYCRQGLGTSPADAGGYPSHWHRFVRECRIVEFLDMITMTYRYLFWHVSEEAATWWRESAGKILAEENLAYDLDSVAGVHPKVDREFQRNMASVIAGFQSERYQGVRDQLAAVEKNLSALPPNYKQAWRSIVSAVETLFAVIFPYAVLSAEEIDRRLLPLMDSAYGDDPVSRKAAQGPLAAFKGWVDAARIYRHQPGVARSADPPADVAVFQISNGASLLRWLVGFDPERVA